LGDDLGESRDLKEDYPGIVTSMQDSLDRIRGQKRDPK
jgi:hypothetical protein